MELKVLVILMISDWNADGGNSDTGGDNGDGIEDDIEAVSHFCLIII